MKTIKLSCFFLFINLHYSTVFATNGHIFKEVINGTYFLDNHLMYKCLNQLLVDLIPAGSTTVVTFGDGVDRLEINDLRENIIKPLNLTVILTSQNLSTWLEYYSYETPEPRLIEKPQYQIMFASYAYQMEEILFLRYQEQNWTPDTKLIFIILDEICLELPCAETLIMHIAKMFVKNFVILIQVKEKISFLTISDLSNCYESINIQEIGGCIGGFMDIKRNPNNKRFKAGQKYGSIFKPVNYNYFINCELKIKENNRVYPQSYYVPDEKSSTKSLDGLAVRFIFLLVDLMHLNISKTYPTFPWCDWPAETGLLHGAPVTGNKYGVYDPFYFTCLWLQPVGSCFPWNVLHYIFKNDLVIVVTKEYGTFPLWHIFLNLFSPVEWLFQIAVFSILSAIWIVSAQLKFHVKIPNRNEGQIILNMFSAMLGFPIKFRIGYLSIRIVFLVWLLYSINFMVLLQSSYTGMLAHPKRQRQVNTLRQVLEKRIPLIARNTLASIVLHYVKEIDKDYEMAITNGLIFEKSNAYFRREGGAAYAVSHFISLGLLERGKLNDPKNTYRPIAIIGETLLPSYASMSLPIKGHIWTDKLNEWIHRAHASGFSSKILGDQFSRADVLDDYDEQTEVISLTFYDYICSIILASISYLLSGIVFIGEIIWKRFKV